MLERFEKSKKVRNLFKSLSKAVGELQTAMEEDLREMFLSEAAENIGKKRLSLEERQKIINQINCEIEKVAKKFGYDIPKIQTTLYSLEELYALVYQSHFTGSYFPNEIPQISLNPYKSLWKFILPEDLFLESSEGMTGLIAHEISENTLIETPLMRPLFYMRNIAVKLASKYHQLSIFKNKVWKFIDYLANLKAKKKGFGKYINALKAYDIPSRERNIIKKAMTESKKDYKNMMSEMFEYVDMKK